jgi:SAM-dependent methyltransferase
MDWTCARCGHRPQSIDGYTAFAPELAYASQGYDAAYYEDLYRLEAGNYWFRARNALVCWALRKFIPDASNLLEIGCGTGYVLAGIADAAPRLDLFGSEISSGGLAYAGRRVQCAELFQMDARAIPFRDHFDVIGAFDVLEHVEDDLAVLKQAHTALRPGGNLIVTVPQHAFLWSPADEHARHVRRYERRELRDKLEHSGFTIVMVTSFVSLLLPLMFASRRLRGGKSDFDVMAELRVAPLTNVVLASVLALERALIHCGMRFSFGGSLLAVARRGQT